ncbi:MAG: class I SAM-dependent methyltransferase, partial [Planctomycetota bacterium]
SPLPDAGEIARNAVQLFDTSVDGIPSVDLNRSEQLSLVGELAAFYDELPFPEKKTDGVSYFLDNEWFAYGDGIVLYAMLRRFRPRRILEIGSGFSSAVMIETSRRFLNESVEMTFIEPSPERLFGLMSTTDRQRYRVIQQTLWTDADQPERNHQK